ncbi:hypothetical protein [Xiashengella succiniciproducens]|jgi:hypothetical protein|uniref:Dialkylrecorsinol condensing enzyme DarA n=1 Tax=Xiashengella succiniciproducens TaxID=2949635 RepID=A0A9J6ZQ62_9BACT|nr:hypothetical protein [Alkaliflexus sp. Ai-910]URW79400.1 hypothetical protein M9189_11085 [Alkaliflexus sp. Ai-910]
MKVLYLSYSQSGQLDEIAERFFLPFSSHKIDRVKVRPSKPFPFPWTSAEFFDAMPETVLEEPIQLEPLNIPGSDYDLIVLGYQPWFLSPSLPVTALLKSDEFKTVVQGKPVVTIVGSRNMWINSQISINRLVEQAGAKVVANIPFSDKTNNIVSAVTILYWMLSGHKERMWGVFPKPGVSDEDIERAGEPGRIVLAHAESGEYTSLQEKIADFVTVPTDILFIEKRAKRLFRIWAGIIKRFGKTPRSRRLWVSIYKYYLIIALFIVAPIVLLVYYILVLPFVYKRVAAEKKRVRLNLI